jgi:hypothetical protein
MPQVPKVKWHTPEEIGIGCTHFTCVREIAYPWRLRSKVKLSLHLTKHYAMKAYGGVDVQIHVFFTSTLVWGEWSALRHDRFSPGKRAPDTYWIGGWVCPRGGLNYMEKWKFFTLLGFELWPLCCSTISTALPRSILISWDSEVGV